MKLKLKQSLAGNGGEFAPGDTYETTDLAEAQRLVLRGIATLHPDEKERLPAVSAKERAAIVSGRVSVTNPLGVPIDGSDTGERNWAGMYKPLAESK
jgi:hypothetical protein